MRGKVANAVIVLRVALKRMQDLKTGGAPLAITLRSSARALSLLYPITQTCGSLLLVERKQEKRKTPSRKPRVGRFGFKWPRLLEVKVGDDTDTNFFSGFSGDMESGGLFIATYDIHPIGTVVHVKAKLPNGHLVYEEATVKWVREYNEHCPEAAPGMGVVFENLSPPNKQEIEQFMVVRDSIFFEAV
jgi:uncharacterized protein (TIGR02266 family)